MYLFQTPLERSLFQTLVFQLKYFVWPWLYNISRKYFFATQPIVASYGDIIVDKVLQEITQAVINDDL